MRGALDFEGVFGMIYFDSSRSVMAVIALALLGTTAARANSLGENAAWQFNSSADKVNKAFLEDMRQKKLNGQYSAPVFTTNIDKQFNCNLSSSSIGNVGTNGLANSGPAASGNLATAKGNESQTDVYKRLIGDSSVGITASGDPTGRHRYWNGFDWVTNSSFDSSTGVTADVLEDQSNQGAITATTSGDISSTMGDSQNYQVLNSSQDNSGSQTARIDASTACSFASVD